MNLKEFIAKYEPLGWHFDYVECHIDNYWTFQSPRMQESHAISAKDVWANNSSENPENITIDEEKMLAEERQIYYYYTYSKKAEAAFDKLKNDMVQQIKLMAKKNLDMPESIDVSFTLKFK